MANNTTTIKFVGQFDSSGITKGLQEIKKQITSSNISEELKKQLQDSFNKVEVNLPKLDKFMKKEDFNLKELAEYQKLVQEITKDMTNFSKAANEADFTKSFSEEDTARLKKFDEQIKQIDNRLKTTKEEIIKTFSNSDKGKIGGKSNNTLNGFIEQLISVPPDKIEEKLDEVIKDAETQADQAVDRLQTIFKNKATGHKGGKGFIELLFGENSGVSLKQGKTLGGSTKGDQGAYSAFNDIREQVLKLEKDAGPDKINPILEAYSKFIEEFFNVPKDKHSVLDGLVTLEMIERLREFKGPEGIEGLKRILGEGNLKLLAEGEAEKLRLTKEQAAELKKIVDGLAEKGEITRDQADNLIKKLTGLSGTINDNVDAAKHLDNQHKALSATFSSLAKRITNSISALTVFNRSIQITRQAVNSVRELDAAFTQIAIVSEQTNEQAWQMFDSFNKLAKQYSITTKDLTEGAKLFYQQGLSAADTMKMVEASTISAALGEVTMTEAANTLTAAIQGYNESASVAMDYTDKIAMVGAVSAADFNELSAAMEKTASSAYTAGIDFDHLLGYLGKMIEVTREAPANLGTAMKTIIARFEDMKKDPAALIDGASANKVEAALATIGIALRDTAGEFRPLQDVFDELGMAWKNLTRNQQAYIATVAAGSRQQSRFLAMMNNYPRTLELIRESQNSAGAALRQYETYQNSAAAASARLTASWEKFYSKIADSKMIVNVINDLTKLVEVMSKIGPTWTAAIATIGAHGINKIITGDLVSKAINFFGQNITSSAGKKLTLTIGSVLKDGIKFGMKEAFNKFEPGDFEGFKNAFAAAGQEGAKGLLAGIGKIGMAIGGIVPELLIIAGIIATILVAVKTISLLVDYNNKAIERELLATSKLAKEEAERYEKKKKEKNIIEDNYKTYKKYEDIIVLTDEELEEQNKAVDAIKEQYNDLVIITDEYGRKIINNTDDLIKHNNQLKIDTKELEKQLALNKLIAVQQSESSEKKYGKGNKTFMQDWTVEQLTNSGFNLEEAETLDAYGEMFRNKDKRNGTFWDYFGAAFNFSGKEYLKDDSLYNQIVNDLIGTGQFNWSTRGTFTNSDSEWGKLIAENVEAIQNANKEELERIVNLSLVDLDDKGKAYAQVIQKYAQIALDAQEILEKQIKEFAKSTLISTIDEIDYGLKDSVLQNDAFNLYSNLSAFNNNSLIEQLIGDETNPQKIQQKMEEVGKAINDYVNNLNPADQKSFHDLSEKLLDPSLSPDKKRALVEKFRIDANGISDEMDKILDQFVEGTNYDIKRREKLNQVLGITDTNFLRQFNSSQLRIIDQLRTVNKKDSGFDFGSYIQTETGKDMLKMLSSLETDITKDPTIYKKAQDTMIKFFKRNFKLDDKEAFDTFQEMFGNLPEIAVEAAESNFSSAKELILTEPTKALSKKQTEAYQQLEGLLGDSLRSYIEINKQGEEYLTVAGKIAVFEKSTKDYRNAIIAEGDNYISQIEQIFAISKKNNDNEYILTKEQKKQIENLEHEIELNSKKLEQLDRIAKYTSQVTAETANISMAKGYSDNLKVFKQAEDEMKKFNGVMNNDTAAAIMAMDASYVKYLNKRLVGEDYYYTVSEEGLKNLREEERKNYNKWIEEQKGKLQNQIDILDAELKYFQEVVDAEGVLSEGQTQKEFDDKVKALDGKLEKAETELEGEVELEEDKNKEILIGAKDTAAQFHDLWSASYSALREEWDELAKAMAENRPTDGKSYELTMPEIREAPTNSDLTTPNKPSIGQKISDKIGKVKVTEEQPETQEEKNKRVAQEQVDRIKAVLERLQLAKDALVPLGPELEDTTKGSGKADEALKKLTKTIENLADALEDLDKLIKDVNRDLNDISVDIDPFKDIFEQWEHEWDYFYNIKTLISNISRSRNMFSQISGAEWASPQQRMEADRAILGTAMADASARKKYAEGLMAAIIQKGTDMTEKYGQFGRFDPTSMTWYQRDNSLTDINAEQAKNVEEINRLQEEQWRRGNDLATEQAKLEALEKEKSAYEEILSTLESQRDTLKDNEDINYDTSDIEAKIAAEKGVIDAIDGQIDAQKNLIKTIEDELKDIDFDLYTAQGAYDFWDKFVSDMESDISSLNEMITDYYDNVSEVMEDANTYWEMYTDYIETTINTEQELYDAIVENYQKEIDQKKKQYDELKQLDNDYLQTVKDNIAKERQARDDSSKQKSYQQSLQRAQLLAQDTSGAYRKELASLKKDIESQRQDLYDDLVDKQVEALEKEIEKRHELYDKEVAALEDRLAYMQENAILLWQMVDDIVAQGSEAMMATLESTTDYINSSERSKEQQRRTWELNVQKTVETATNDTVEQWGILAKVLGEIGTQTFPNYKAEAESYTATLTEAEQAMIAYRDVINTEKGNLDEVMSGLATSLSTKMEEYITDWAGATSKFTGNVSAYGDIVNNMIASTSTNISTLEGWNKGLEVSGGKIIKTIEYYDEELAKKYAEIYKTYEEERTAHKTELESLIATIQSEIEGAAKDAADAIRKAVEGLQSSSQPKPADTGTREPGGGQPTKPTNTDTKQPGSGVGGYKGYTVWVNIPNYNLTGKDFTYQEKASFNNATYEQLIESYNNLVSSIRRKYNANATFWQFTPFKIGGFADFTGPAWLDGTKSQPEAVLNAKQTKLFTSMVNSLEKASNNSNINSALGSSYNIGDINTNINVEKLDNETDIDKVARQVENRILKSIRNRVSVAIA